MDYSFENNIFSVKTIDGYEELVVIRFERKHSIRSNDSIIERVNRELNCKRESESECESRRVCVWERVGELNGIYTEKQIQKLKVEKLQ